jgi:5-(carboxyamino)imidazole ribonucleotide synthase
MLAMAAKSMGYRVHVFSPESDSPAGQVADLEVVAAYEDLSKVREFAAAVDVLTFEFENVPSVASRAAAEKTTVRPSGDILHTTQHRLREKTFLQQSGFPVPPFRVIDSRADLQAAAVEIGFPGVLKTASFGYDGKGQRKILSLADLDPAYDALAPAQGIYEGFVNFAKEVSVVAARTVSGEFKAFPVFENVHAHHILDVTFAPADLPPSLAREATDLARRILEALNVVGLLTVELFVTHEGQLVVNELAPRTHNSGHLTLDACVTSQFEQQVRAVCGLPLGSVELLRPAAMANLLGDVWQGGEPDWRRALEDPWVKLHLYGKTEPRAGRKMGHLTALGENVQDAVARVRLARQRLSGSPEA